MNATDALKYARLIDRCYAVDPHDLTDASGSTFAIDGDKYTVVSTVYANDLATDMSPNRDDDVSIGLVVTDAATGDLVVAFRGTEGIFEWIHDAEFYQTGRTEWRGRTENGFTAIYWSLRYGSEPDEVDLLDFLLRYVRANQVDTVTLCGHSLGGSLATFLAADVARKIVPRRTKVCTLGCPRVGDRTFAETYQAMIGEFCRVENRFDLVPHLPLGDDWTAFGDLLEITPFSVVDGRPQMLVQPTTACQHSLATYRYLLSRLAGVEPPPVAPGCRP